jgi:hypothetical protein
MPRRFEPGATHWSGHEKPNGRPLPPSTPGFVRRDEQGRALHLENPGNPADHPGIAQGRDSRPASLAPSRGRSPARSSDQRVDPRARTRDQPYALARGPVAAFGRGPHRVRARTRFLGRAADRRSSARCLSHPCCARGPCTSQLQGRRASSVGPVAEPPLGIRVGPDARGRSGNRRTVASRAHVGLLQRIAQRSARTPACDRAPLLAGYCGSCRSVASALLGFPARRRHGGRRRRRYGGGLRCARASLGLVDARGVELARPQRRLTPGSQRGLRRSHAKIASWTPRLRPCRRAPRGTG